jgi:tetratricopeptide (TPR) repeat protein
MRAHPRVIAKPRKVDFARRFVGDGLEASWGALHTGDREPFPGAAHVAQLAKRHAPFARWMDDHGGAAKVAAGVQEAWRRFHAGDFAGAVATGAKFGALGAIAANKAAVIHSLMPGVGDPSHWLTEAIERGERAILELPDSANAHYMLALALGRYSQRISILRAAADGTAARVRKHLDATLELEPRHAEACVALGMYHAEIVSKIGGMLAGLTYRASATAALEHFQRALKLAPKSPIVRIEYANGLSLLNTARSADEVATLYAEAAALDPRDAMEQLDVERARRGP